MLIWSGDEAQSNEGQGARNLQDPFLISKLATLSEAVHCSAGRRPKFTICCDQFMPHFTPQFTSTLSSAAKEQKIQWVGIFSRHFHLGTAYAAHSPRVPMSGSSPILVTDSPGNGGCDLQPSQDVAVPKAQAVLICRPPSSPHPSTLLSTCTTDC